MKLELKHLAPYLPYGLKIQGTTHGEIAELSCCTETSVNITTRSFQYGMWADIFEIKPILRPLSDLTEGFLKDIKKMMLVDFEYIDKDSIQSIHFPTGNISITSIHYEIVEECPLGFYNYLLKNHFDVFGLIEKGLAIDINTLN
jgi:hypothetical protein